MKKFYFLLSIVILMAMVSGANAQGDFSSLIKSNAADATILLDHYAQPLFKGFGTGLNSGWNNTAKTKKFLHIDLRISAAVAIVPTSDQSFDVTKIGLSSNLRVDPSSPTTIAPTFGGSKSDATPLMDIYANGTNTGKTFSMPSGIIKYIPAPNVQLTIGLIKNTDLTVRATPSISIGTNGGSVQMLGFGLKHNIMEDLVGKKVKKIVPFDLAIALNYNQIAYTNSLTVTPDAGTVGPPADFSNQRIKGTFSAFNAQAIISKKLLFFTPFLSVGYETSNTDLSVLGNYPFTNGVNSYSVSSNPVHINESGVNGFRADAGFQLNLLILRIYASVSEGQYVSGNLGVGLGF